jgi:hypothetical protein
MSGCNCARNVIAHMMYMATAESTSVERQTLHVSISTDSTTSNPIFDLRNPSAHDVLRRTQR